MGGYKRNIIWVTVTNLPSFEHPQKIPLTDFSKTYGVINYGSGWRKDVVDQCLEFDPYPHCWSYNNTELPKH